MALVKKHSLPTYHLCFILLSTFSLASISAPASNPALCVIPSPAPKRIPAAGKDALSLLQLFQLTAGYFVGGEELHFAQEEGDDWSYVVPRSFSILPHSVERTEGDSGLVHVTATLTLSGGRTRLLRGRAGRQRGSYLGGHTVSFSLDGYYSNSTSGELCMTGAGTYSEDEDGTIQHLPGVVLKLRLPNPPSLTDPFVSGSLLGDGFKAISLVAYAESDSYRYGKPASCASSWWPSLFPARGDFHAFGGAKFSCVRLREHLVSSFKLRYDNDDAHASSISWLHEPSMHISQVRCTADGAVRAYVSFSNNTKTRRSGLARRPNFTVKEEAVVAEGRWDSARNMLCLRACRVARSESEPQECGVGMSFGFPGIWTVRERSAVAGMLWNSSQAAGSSGAAAVGAVFASSIDIGVHRGSFSDVKYIYNYTMDDKAKEQYLASDLSKCDKKNSKGSFISANYTYRDFEFRYHGSDFTTHVHGNAFPVAIGSVMVYGDRLAADDSFSQHAVVNKDDKDELLKVSYEIRHSVPPAGWVRPTNTSSYAISLEQHIIMAEGVYDPKTGVLCMIGCREFNFSTDCEMLITVQFASLETKALQHGKGAISSLREKADPLFFNKTEIMLYGMYTEDISESISRMDMESIMLAISTTLPCVFTVLQILHAKRNPDASAATSITMLVVMALGYVAPLLVGSDTLFTSRRTRWLPFESYVPYELNQAMMRAPTLITLLLQLRLIQLALSSRKSAPDQSKAETSSSAAERRALWVCLPLYSAGAALTVIVNVVNRRRAEASLTVYVGPGPATLWQDLVSSAGLALDAFLLPQVAMNAFSAGGGVVSRAISPWFYVGGTVVRSMPHVYDVIRRQGYVPSVRPSYVYADPRDDRFGLAWDVAVPCVAGVLAVLLFLQQRRAGAFLPRPRKSGGYEMVSSI